LRSPRDRASSGGGRNAEVSIKADADTAFADVRL
jgi:hypothetical protein